MQSFGSGGAIISGSGVNNAVFDSSKYFHFSVKPDPGYSVNFTELVIVPRSNTSNGNNCQWMVKTSVDGFTDPIGTVFGSLDGTHTIVLGSEFQNILHTESVTFKVYPWDSGNVGQVVGLASGTQLKGRVQSAILSSDPNSQSYVDEVQLRTLVANSRAGDRFSIEEFSGWTLTDTLVIPNGAGLISNSYSSKAPLEDSDFSRGYTFRRSSSFVAGVNKPLAQVTSNVFLQGITFDGSGTGSPDEDGVVAVAPSQNESITNLFFNRVDIQHVGGDAFVLDGPSDGCVFQFCKFDFTGGHGVRFSALSPGERHSRHRWFSCHFQDNDHAAVSIQGPVWHNLFANGEWISKPEIYSPCFEHHVPNGSSKGISIRDSVLRGNGRAWINLDGDVDNLVVSDSRLKHNAQDPDSTQGPYGPLELTDPVGLFHVERGRISLSIRGGAGWYDNSQKIFTTVNNQSLPSKFTVNAGGFPILGSASKKIITENSMILVTDAERIADGATVKVSSGFALDPDSGLISY
ncbi:MAG: hypothetical protein AAF546_06295 [Verrucomicrobiota bacterium]